MCRPAQTRRRIIVASGFGEFGIGIGRRGRGEFRAGTEDTGSHTRALVFAPSRTRLSGRCARRFSVSPPPMFECAPTNQRCSILRCQDFSNVTARMSCGLGAERKTGCGKSELSTAGYDGPGGTANFRLVAEVAGGDFRRALGHRARTQSPARAAGVAADHRRDAVVGPHEVVVRQDRRETRPWDATHPCSIRHRRSCRASATLLTRSRFHSRR
jgi:hypothetical protein